MTKLETADRRVYLDTNILINDFFFRRKQAAQTRPSADERAAGQALAHLRKFADMRLVVASFSLVQVIQTLSRGKVAEADVRREVQLILSRFEIANLADRDIQQALSLAGPDLEDLIQYAVCKKMQCAVLLTHNVRDFRNFATVRVVPPKSIRAVLF